MSKIGKAFQSKSIAMIDLRGYNQNRKRDVNVFVSDHMRQKEKGG